MSKISKTVNQNSSKLVEIFKKNIKKLKTKNKNDENNHETQVVKIKKEDISDEEKELVTGNALYRVLFFFSDLYWYDTVELPKEELFIVFDFLGKNYKIPLTNIYSNIKYIDVDFYKLFYVITDQQKGFFEFVEKNKV